MDVSLLDLLKSVLVQIFGILLPGCALYILLYPKKQNVLGALFLSYALGYAGNIISYFFLVPFGLQVWVPLYLVLTAVVSSFVLYKNKGKLCLLAWEKADLAFALFFLLYLVIHQLVTVGVTAPPSVTGTLSVHQDHLYWLENAVSLSKRFPPIQLRAAVDATYYYHYFSSIQLAFASLASGIDIYTLGSTLYPQVQCFLMFGSFYVLYRGLIQSQKLCFFGLAVILFCTGLERSTAVTYLHHTLVQPFGFDIGFSFGAWFLYALSMQVIQAKFNLRGWILTILFCFIATGAKAPVAVVLLVVAGTVCLSWMIKKQYHLAFSYGFGILGIFVFVAIIFAGLFLSAGQVGKFSLTYFLERKEIAGIIWKRISANWPLHFHRVLIVSATCLAMHPLAVGLCGMGGVSMTIDQRMRNSLNVGLLLSASCGFALGLFNIQDGSSQIYFSMAAIIPSLLCGLLWLDTARLDWTRIGRQQAAIVCGGLMFVQICLFLFQGSTYVGYGMISPLRLGCTAVFSREEAQQDFSPSGIQESDAEALSWVRDHTPQDSILMADRSVVGGMPTYMFYGTFAERQMYLEGDVYFREQYVAERDHMRTVTQEVFQNSRAALEMAIDEGVDYIVQTIWLTPDFSPDLSLVRLAHSSESINIYEVIP